MKGMFVKNWIVTWQGIRRIFVFFTVAQLFMMLPFVDSVISNFMSSLMPLAWVASLLEYKEKSRCRLYDDMMPGGRKADVFGMYFFVFSYLAAMVILNLMLYIPLAIFCPDIISASRLAWMPALAALIPLLVFAVTFPVFYKFGHSIYRALTSVIMFIILAIFGVGAFASEQTSWESGVVLLGVELNGLTLIVPLLLIGAVVIYFISMLLSVRLYKSVEQ